jgi:predicted membrane protein DUF2207
MTMDPTLSGRCDRAGRGWRRAVLLLVACLLTPSPAAAAGPGAYAAQRFDVNAKVLAGGNLDVTETITFEFQTGTFQRIWRDIPRSRTDGIEIIEAWMDGNPITRGEGPGHINVSDRNSRTRVEWQFAPIGTSTHTFELRYIARGVAYPQGGSDVVRWRLLPSEHGYKIGASHSTIVAPATPAGTPALESRRVEHVSTAQPGNRIEVLATGIDKNGWVIAEVYYPAGSVVTTLPDWQQRQVTAAALAPRWEMAAAALFIAPLLTLLIIRQSYTSPEFHLSDQTTTPEPPEPLPAALAAALAGNGRASGFQSVSTLLDLADRGVLIVRELPKKLGSRNYELSQVPGKHDLANHEAEALTIAFGDVGDDVTMSQARRRLTRGARRFSNALNSDLEERGLLDPSRKAIRDRLTTVSIVMLVAAGAGAIGVAPFIPRYQGWPFLLPLALAICGIIGVVMAAATTSLSDAGLMQGARWRGFKRHLKALADARDDSGGAAIRSRWIVYGIALGLAHQWSRYLKKHPDVAPAWFVAGADAQAGGAFAAFVGSNAASTSAAGHGGGGGGAAGGGGSGAG